MFIQLLFILNVRATECNKNIRDLNDVKKYFSSEVWTRCDYNGKQIDCDKLKDMLKYVKKDKTIDPNERMLP